MMGAFFEEVEGIIRGGPTTYSYGDLYESCVGVKRIDSETCEFVGYNIEQCGQITLSNIIFALECIYNLGYKKFIITRKRPDGSNKQNIYNIQKVLERHQRQNNVGEEDEYSKY